MFALRFLLLLTGLLLVAFTSLAQGTPKPAVPAEDPQTLVVRVTVPTAIATLSDYATTLFSRQQGKLKALTAPRPLRTSNPVLVFTVPLPKGWGTKKEEKASP